MAIDPNAPDELKRPRRTVLGRIADFAANPLNPGQPTPPNVQFIEPPVGERSLSPRIPTTTGGAGEVNVVDPARGPALTPTSRAAGLGRIPLPEGVQEVKSAPGVYEGKRGLFGERVFSDNPYDRGLRVRNPGQTRYDFSTPGATPDAGTRIGLRRDTPEWAAANQAAPAYTPGQNVDYDALGSQVAANKAALAETRVARGAGYDPTGYVAAGRAAGGAGALGATGPLKPADALGLARLSTDVNKFQTEQDRADLERLDQISGDTFTRFAEAAKANPGLARGGDPNDYATLAAAEELAASGVDPDFTKTRVGRAARDIITRRLGSALSARGASDTFTPGAPNDLADYSIQPGGFFTPDTIQGAPYDESGRRLTPTEVAQREQQGLSVNRGSAPLPRTVLGINLGEENAKTFNDPLMRRLTDRIVATDRDRRSKRETK